MSRVLMLEDSLDLAESVIRALEMRGHEVVHAMTVAEARDAYKVDLFDVLLCDYELPDGTGLDFLSGVRGSDKAVTILWSGLHRDRELAASGMTVDHLLVKNDPMAALAAIEAAR